MSDSEIKRSLTAPTLQDRTPDPGTGKRSTAGSDLAALEVSVLLHHQLECSALINVCQVLYDPHTILDTTHVEKLDHSVAQKLANFIGDYERTR
jgi:predicted TPR repeat methyltransferase